MSLYNMIHGVNPLAVVLLSALNLTPNDVGRFRDCYLARRDAEDEKSPLEIHVYTRNGGGNREEYQDTMDELAQHELYLRDFDDDFDCTYATIAFRIPERFKELLEALVAADPSAISASPHERFEAFMTKLQSGEPDPAVERVKAAMKPLFEALSKKIEGS